MDDGMSHADTCFEKIIREYYREFEIYLDSTIFTKLRQYHKNKYNHYN